MTRLYAYAAGLALAATGYLWWSHRVEQKAVQNERARVEHQAELQRTANRSRSYEAEQRQASQTIYRDRFLTKTIVEVRHATQNLAACPVSDDAVRLLNAAAKCASEERSSACPAGDTVRPPG